MAEQSQGIPVNNEEGEPAAAPAEDPQFETVYDPERGGHYPPAR
ncbi:hypothetical protein ACWGH2_16310 [Streptomyces sp. NPDC054871]